MEHETLASELLHEVKAASKRWFIAFLIMVILEASTIFAFVWYITLPVDEFTVEDVNQQADFAGRNVIIGGDDYGG